MSITAQPRGAALSCLIVDPAAETKKTSFVMAPRLVTLKDQHLAIVDNSKHNASTLLKSLRAVLVENYGVASIEFYRKDNPSIAMPLDALAAISSRCSAVIHGVAD